MVTVEVLIGAGLSLLLVGSGAFYFIMTEIRITRRELRLEILEAIRAEGQERRMDSQRILEAIHFHRHDSDGAAVFYPPTPATPAPSAD